MNVLHIVDTIDPKKGGISQAVQTMAAEIAKSGNSNEIASLDSSDKFGENHLYTVNTLGPSKGPWSYSNKLLPWLLNNLSRFDKVIIHGLWLYAGFATAKAISVYKKTKFNDPITTKVPQLYIMPHGMLDPYFQQAKTRKLKAIRNFLYWKLVEGSIVNKSDGLLFTCEQECLLARQPFKPYRPKKEMVVGLGINEPPVFLDSMKHAFLNKCKLADNDRYFLYLGRIDEKKGVDILILAYYKLLTAKSSASQFPSLIIAGPGMETEYGKKILALLEGYKTLKSKVFFPGMLQGQAKWGAFYGSEVFMLPSHQENFGIAVVEAMACHKSVIISKHVNLSSEIKNENAGIIHDDTLEGTYEALKTWNNLTLFEKTKLEDQARLCYQNLYGSKSATNRLLNAISFQ